MDIHPGHISNTYSILTLIWKSSEKPLWLYELSLAAALPTRLLVHIMGLGVTIPYHDYNPNMCNVTIIYTNEMNKADAQKRCS
jgi:hypothetical protein